MKNTEFSKEEWIAFFVERGFLTSAINEKGELEYFRTDKEGISEAINERLEQ